MRSRNLILILVQGCRVHCLRGRGDPKVTFEAMWLRIVDREVSEVSTDTSVKDMQRDSRRREIRQMFTLHLFSPASLNPSLYNISLKEQSSLSIND